MQLNTAVAGAEVVAGAAAAVPVVERVTGADPGAAAGTAVRRRGVVGDAGADITISTRTEYASL